MTQQILSHYFIKDLVPHILKYDTHYHLMNDIKNFNKNPKKNSTRLRKMRMGMNILEIKTSFNRQLYLNNLKMDRCYTEMYEIIERSYNENLIIPPSLKEMIYQQFKY